MRARIASGNQLVGYKPRYGYESADAEKFKLALNSVTAPIVRLLFQ